MMGRARTAGENSIARSRHPVRLVMLGAVVFLCLVGGTLLSVENRVHSRWEEVVSDWNHIGEEIFLESEPAPTPPIMLGSKPRLSAGHMLNRRWPETKSYSFGLTKRIEQVWGIWMGPNAYYLDDSKLMLVLDRKVFGIRIEARVLPSGIALQNGMPTP